MDSHHLQAPDQKPDRPVSFTMFTWYTDSLPELEEPTRVRPNSSPVTSSPPPSYFFATPRSPEQSQAPDQHEQKTVVSMQLPNFKTFNYFYRLFSFQLNCYGTKINIFFRLPKELTILLFKILV